MFSGKVRIKKEMTEINKNSNSRNEAKVISYYLYSTNAQQLKLVVMKWIMTLLFLCLGWVGLLGQDSNIEELKKKLQEADNTPTRMSINYELGKAYLRKDTEVAMDYAKKAFQQATDVNNSGMAASAAYLVAQAYERERRDRNTEVWLKSCLQYAKQAGDADLIIKSVDKRSRLATKDRNYRRAYEINREAFDYFSEKGRSISELEQKYALQKAALEKEKAKLEAEIQRLAEEKETINSDKNRLEARQQQLLRAKEQVEREITAKEERLATVAEQKEQAEELAKQREQEYKQLSREALEKEAQLEAARADQAEAQLLAERNQRKAERTRKLITLIAVIAVALVLLALSLYSRFRASRRAKQTLEEKNQEIQAEQKRSDRLLLNILPAPIAYELKHTGRAKARRYDEATVLFIDFKNFTRISEQLEPEDLVEELHRCFKAFDEIVSRYKDIEKIKTIGDAYMCASGLNERRTLPHNIVKAALEMQEFLEEERHKRSREGKPSFSARVGIHTGPVVAGVVGEKKFAYDIWGDTVNIAARMESKSEEGRVNISETTFRLVKYQFDCEYRGKVQAKNKGAIDMYFVNRQLDAVPA